MAYARLSRKVDDSRKTVLGKQRRHADAIREVELDEPKAVGFGELRAARFLQGGIVVGVHVVEADHRPAFGQEPLRDVKALRHDKPRERRPLTREEVKRLLERTPEPWRGIWYALLTTGMRVGELSELRFSDIDWRGCEIIVRATVAKNHRERRIPIDDELGLKALASWCQVLKGPRPAA